MTLVFVLLVNMLIFRPGFYPIILPCYFFFTLVVFFLIFFFGYIAYYKKLKYTTINFEYADISEKKSFFL